MLTAKNRKLLKLVKVKTMDCIGPYNLGSPAMIPGSSSHQGLIVPR